MSLFKATKVGREGMSKGRADDSTGKRGGGMDVAEEEGVPVLGCVW